jgi:hypothetical protein
MCEAITSSNNQRMSNGDGLRQFRRRKSLDALLFYYLLLF